MKNRKETGNLGEKLARDFLKKKGYKIIEMNYRCPAGEMDIIAKQKDCLVFVEVRTKTGTGFGSPEESVTATKRAHLRNVAVRYLQEKTNLPEQWRIDFIAVELEPTGKVKRIEQIESAVGEE